MLTAQRLRELLHYDPETGVFTWAVYKGQRAKAGSVAGNTRTDGYTAIKIDGIPYRCHRLAWLHFYGVWPDGEVDHWDGDHANNRIKNLRDARHSLNMQNRRSARKGSRTGVIGVTIGPGGKFIAQLMTSGKQKHLGSFATLEEARSAYIEAKRASHEGCTI